MTITSHILGYPRIGAKRQLKFASEAYWKDDISYCRRVYCWSWKHGCECGTNHAEVSDEQATSKFVDQLLAIYIQLLDDLIVIINNNSKD